MTIQYNEDQNNLLIDALFQSQGPTVFNETAGGQSWTIQDGENYTEFFTRVGSEQLNSTDDNQFAAYLVNQTTTTNAEFTDINVLVYANTASEASYQTFGAVMLESIAQVLTKKSQLKIGFTSHALPPNEEFQSVADTTLPLTFCTLFGVLATILNFAIARRINNNFHSGYHNSTLMKGSTRMTYLLGVYLVDVAHYLLVIPICYAFLYLFDFQIPGFWLITATWAFVTPI